MLLLKLFVQAGSPSLGTLILSRLPSIASLVELVEMHLSHQDILEPVRISFSLSCLIFFTDLLQEYCG